MKTCTNKICFADRAQGDNLFCGECRIRWKKVCITNFGNQQVNGMYVNKLLTRFKDGGLK